MLHSSDVGLTYLQLINFKYVKPTSDVWSIAATFYRMLAGQPVMDFPAGADPLAVILESKQVPLARRVPGLPPRLAQVFDRALAVEPAQRHPSAVEMLDEMKRAL